MTPCSPTTGHRTRPKARKKITPYCSWPWKCVWQRVCVFPIGNRDVWELGAQAGVCAVRAGAHCQRDRGGLVDPRQPALPDLCSLHQTGGPRRRQVRNLDTSECSHWTAGYQLEHISYAVVVDKWIWPKQIIAMFTFRLPAKKLQRLGNL